MYTPTIFSNQKDLLVQLSSSFIGDGAVVNSLEGHEAISELFEFRISFFSSQKLDLEKALRSPICVAIKSDTQERYIDGVIARFSQGRTELQDDIYTTEYFVEMRPKFWLMSLDQNYLMFQNKSAIDIIKKVIKDGGVTDMQDKTRTCGKRVREYCIQYGESSFNFVSRLMEEEGIFYFFEHKKGKHTLVLADSASVYEKVTEEKVGFVKAVGETTPLNKIFDTRMTTSVNTGASAVADYNYTISQTKLYSKLAGKWKGECFYEYPGNFTKAKEGDDISKLRVEMFELEHCVLQASSTAANLTPGYTFKLTDHFSDIFNKAYVVCSIDHYIKNYEYTGFSYQNEFRAIEKEIIFRPQRRTCKPRIFGTQTAVVVCPPKEEIYRDQYCSVKVHFHWDQIGKKSGTDDSSCWIRVAQSLAGNNWGGIFVPRVGQEVVVSFLEGDPDRPLIVGCVYNDKYVPAYSENEAKKSSLKTVTYTDDSGFNEIRFDDEKDKEEIYVHAQKDVNIEIENSRTTLIKESNDTLTLQKGHRSITLEAKDKEANHTVLLKKGNSEFTIEKGDQIILLKKGKRSITLKDGDMSVTLSKGNLSYKVTGKGSFDISKDFTITVKGNLSIKVTGDIKMQSSKNITIKSTMDSTYQAGKNFNAKSTMNMTLKGGMNLNASANMNMALKANMNASIAANINFEAKGNVMAKLDAAMININGKAMTKVTAAMIQLSGLVKLG